MGAHPFRAVPGPSFPAHPAPSPYADLPLRARSLAAAVAAEGARLRSLDLQATNATVERAKSETIPTLRRLLDELEGEL